MYFNTREGFQDDSKQIEVVVARYEEDLSWLNNIPEDLYSKLIIYNKGSTINAEFPKSETFTLPNLGRESHTYLTHICLNYDKLADVTFFIPGSAWTRDDKRKRLLRLIEHLQKNKVSAIIGHIDPRIINETYNFSINKWVVTSEENRKNNSDSSVNLSEDRPLKNWFTKRFPNESINCVSFTGIIAVSREDILKKPIVFYQKLLEELSFPHPEVGHYSERVWKNIFSMGDDSCILDDII